MTYEHCCRHVDSHAHATTVTHTSPPPSIPHSLHLSASVTTRGLYSGIPYTAVAKKCSLEKLYSKRKHNHSSPSISLLLRCSLALSPPPSLCFPTLFPVSGFSRERRTWSTAVDNPFPFLLFCALPIQLQVGILKFRLM